MSTDIVTRAAPRARSSRTLSQEDVVDGGNAASANATALEPSARMRQPYAWPALWMFPVAVLLLALLFRGIRCGRPGRRCQRLCFGDDSDSDDDDDVELGDRRASESGESDAAITPVARRRGRPRVHSRDATGGIPQSARSMDARRRVRSGDVAPASRRSRARATTTFARQRRGVDASSTARRFTRSSRSPREYV